MGKTTHWGVSRQSGDTYLRKPLQGQTNIEIRNQEQGIELCFLILALINQDGNLQAWRNIY